MSARTVAVLSSWAASIARGLGGMIVVYGSWPRPAQTLELYEFEACPFCRKVREALTVLDLDVIVRPCPRGGTRFRPDVVKRGGKAQFPYLVDPNTGTELYESGDIVRYLFATYGPGAPSLWVRFPFLDTLFSQVASVLRPASGMRARPSREPEQLLELWSFENSPYCRLARETLCELELPYLLHNVGKHSSRRPEFRARSGRMMVPYLADPAAGVELHESADIQAHLEARYGA